VQRMRGGGRVQDAHAGSAGRACGRVESSPAAISAALALALTCTLVAPSLNAEAAESAAGEGSAVSILQRAFHNRFEVDTIADIDLVVRNGSGQELRRKLHGVSKVIDGRLCSLGQLVWPERLRGMTVLVLEALDRSHDAFVYLPSMKRVRRISTAQRSDPFFGTDVTYEDLERRRVSDYTILSVRADTSNGEPVHRIEAHSKRTLSYDAIVFVVADTVAAILETEYFERDEVEPFRSIWAPRKEMISADGHVLPTHLRVEDHRRGRSTDVDYRKLRINPPIDPHLFSVATLEHERPLPGERGHERSRSDGNAAR